jgi:DNA-binding transcriptional MerR regulator
MDISEVAKATGLPASTLRFYEEKGLIRSTGRLGLRRLFSANVIERLALIALGRNAGFSLDEIGEMFTPEGPDINRALLLAKADALDRKI